MRASKSLALLLYCSTVLMASEGVESEAIRSAVSGGLSIVQKAAKNYPKHRDCFSCHHQTLPMLAMDIAGRKGLAIDSELMQSQAEFTWNTFHEKRERIANGKGVGGAAMTVSYGLWALDIAKWQSDETTNAMVTYLLKRQRDDGSWHRSSNRPPLEDSDFTCGILAIHYMREFSTESNKNDVEAAAKRLKKWVLATTSKSHEDSVSKLGALALLRCDQQEMSKLRTQILSAQHADGGWSQLPDMDSDAYATGMTLFTLHRTGLKVTEPHFQRGLRFLLDTQLDDGSWFIKSRSKPIQEMFDNGDPHGDNQFISIAGTSWATAALALALPDTTNVPHDDSTTTKADTSYEDGNQNLERESDLEPVFLVADGLNADGTLVENYRRGLRYAIDYFGNYGPYFIYLLGPDSEQSIREIYRKRAESRANPNSSDSLEDQIAEFLKRPNVVAEIDAVLSGKAEGGLTWTQDPPLLYEDVTTNAKEREKNPIENTWGALHEYHHVFQMAHCDTKQERTSGHNINSWMAEGMATYSSAKFMEDLSLIDFKGYMRELRKTGGNIGQPGINDFLSSTETWRLEDESYWQEGGSAQVYYMLGAWATAYLIHVQGVDEVTVLKDWYHDIPRIGKLAAFKKHMGLSLDDFYKKFDVFIRQSDDVVMKIFDEKKQISED